MPGEWCALAPPAAVTLRRQSGPSAKQESSPPHVSLLNPLLWLLPGQQRKATKFPGRLWQAAPLSAGQKLIPSSSPVPPTQGAGLARLAFCVSLSGGVKSREQASQRVVPAPVQPHRQTDRCTVLVLHTQAPLLLSPPSLSTRRCLMLEGGRMDSTPVLCVPSPLVAMVRILTTGDQGTRSSDRVQSLVPREAAMWVEAGHTTRRAQRETGACSAPP